MPNAKELILKKKQNFVSRQIRDDSLCKHKGISVSEKKAVIRMEKDKAKMAQVFLELDDDADGL